MSDYKEEINIIQYLRGYMDIFEYKNYILGLIFYKYLSEKLEQNMNNLLKKDQLTFTQANQDPNLKKHLKQNALDTLGYYLEPELLFKNVLKTKENKIETLKKALKEISNSSLGHKSHETFLNITEGIDFESQNLGTTKDEKDKEIEKYLEGVSKINLKIENPTYAGELFEYFLNLFVSQGKRGDLYYTPPEISTLISKIVGDNPKTVYNPTCGSASLLIKTAKQAPIYGQEENPTTYNIARMNLIIHNINYNNIHIEKGNALENPKHLDKKFHTIVSRPPFNAKWSANRKFLEDPRFREYKKLAPKSKSDMAYIQHMIYQLEDDGCMVVLLPHGILFRAASEETIRKKLIEKNYIDTIIGLPANLLHSTIIPTCLIVFKKSRKNTDILFIDASQEYTKIKHQNKLQPEHIEKIINTYKKRETIPKYSYLAPIEKIKENNYNLNILRYVDSIAEEKHIGLDNVVENLEKLDEKLEKIDKEIIEYCKIIGVKPPVKRKNYT